METPNQVIQTAVSTISPLNKILIALLVITVIGAIGFIIYKEHQISTLQTQLDQTVLAQKTLVDNITRSQDQFATKQDINDLAKQNNINLQAIQQDLSNLGAAVTGMNVVNVNSGGSNKSGAPSTNTTPTTNPPTPITCNNQTCYTDPYGYQTHVQNLSLEEPFSNGNVPIGGVSFDASKQTPWSYNLYPRDYNVVNVLGTDPNGKQYVYNKFTIKVNGKDYPVGITNASFVQETPAASLTWWNPRLFLGVSSGVNLSPPLKGEFTPSVSIGVVSYGQSKVTPAWSFAQVGIGYGAISQKPEVEISPAQYNIGQHLTVIRNTYVGPTLGIGFGGDINVGLGIKVGL